MPLGGHSPLSLLPPWRGGAGACFPRPSKRLLAAPAQPWRRAAAAGLLHSLSHSRGLKDWNWRREGGGVGRVWGGRAREREEDRKTSRTGMTSLPADSEEAGPGRAWPPPPESQVEAGLRA